MIGLGEGRITLLVQVIEEEALDTGVAGVACLVAGITDIGVGLADVRTRQVLLRSWKPPLQRLLLQRNIR